jgi:hypothetical protein
MGTREGKGGGFFAASLIIVVLAGMGCLIWFLFSTLTTSRKPLDIATAPPPAESQPEAPQQPEPNPVPRGIVIKGLRIGMNSQEVSDAIVQKFGAQWELNGGRGQSTWTVTNPGLRQLLSVYAANQLPQPVCYQFDDHIILNFDAAGKLSRIKIGHNCSLDLFGSPNLSEGEFAQMMARAYNIPKLNGERGGWSYTSPDNVKVTISTAREVEMWQGADLNAASRNFN